MNSHTRITVSPVSPVSPADTDTDTRPWRLRDKSFDYDRALSLLADDLLALGRGDVRRPAEPAPVSLGVVGAVGVVGVEKENAP